MTCHEWECDDLEDDICASISDGKVKINENGCEHSGCSLSSIESVRASGTTGSISCPEEPVEYSAGNMSYISGYAGPSSGASGRARMIRDDDETKVTVSAWGLNTNASYKAHAHVLPCQDGAGGHYMDDVSGPVDDVNEIWPSFTTNGSGRSYVEVTANFVARADA